MGYGYDGGMYRVDEPFPIPAFLEHMKLLNGADSVYFDDFISTQYIPSIGTGALQTKSVDTTENLEGIKNN